MIEKTEKIFRIGVQAENTARVEVKGAWGESVLLYQSKYMKDYWYDKSSIWIENGFEEKKESIFGINSCGEWTVTTFGEQGEILEMEKVKIIPKLLTIEQYELMKLEVKKIFEELTYQPEEPDKRTVVKELNLSLYPIAELNMLLIEWKEWISQVEENPAEILLKARVKKKPVVY
ncbi:hypothetical protein FK545_11220 [Planococcus glaciei]|nr:hypothetical protein [Planococcus glaciei]QDY45785.1 hypothetical protein FK545_11220 [Planococcus glaciei]